MIFYKFNVDIYITYLIIIEICKTFNLIKIYFFEVKLIQFLSLNRLILNCEF